MRNIFVSFGGIHAVDNVTVDLFRARSSAWSAATAPASRPDEDPVGRLEARFRRDPDRRQAGRHHQSARRQGARHRDDLPDAGARRQRRRAGQPLPRPRAAHRLGHARRHRHGGGDPQGHGAAQPQLQALQDAGEIAVRRPAPGGRHRPRDPFQRPHPDHGRADRGARAGGDRAGRASSSASSSAKASASS